MSVQAFGRLGVALFLIVLVSGCSSVSQGGSSSRAASEQADACAQNPASCMHEGRYDVDEQEYAEQEAKRLNQAESIRMRRRSLWW